MTIATRRTPAANPVLLTTPESARDAYRRRLALALTDADLAPFLAECRTKFTDFVLDMADIWAHATKHKLCLPEWMCNHAIYEFIPRVAAGTVSPDLLELDVRQHLLRSLTNLPRPAQEEVLETLTIPVAQVGGSHRMVPVGLLTPAQQSVAIIDGVGLRPIEQQAEIIAQKAAQAAGVIPTPLPNEWSIDLPADRLKADCKLSALLQELANRGISLPEAQATARRTRKGAK